MRWHLVWVAALAAIGAGGLPCQASILGKYLTFDGTPDDLTGITRASLFDPGGNGTSVGDVIYGFVSISDTDVGDPSPDEIAVLFAAEILDETTGTGGNTVFRLGAVNPASNGGANAAFTLGNLISTPALQPKVDPGLAPAGATTSDAIGVLVTITGTNPLSPELGALSDFGPAGFQYEATLGIDPASNLTSGDFLHFAPVGFAGIVGGMAGGLSVFDDPFASSVIYLPVTTDRLDDDNATPHDVTMFNGVVNENQNASSPWDFTGSASFQLNAVPEPASVATWALLGFGVIVGLMVRRGVRCEV